MLPASCRRWDENKEAVLGHGADCDHTSALVLAAMRSVTRLRSLPPVVAHPSVGDQDSSQDTPKVYPFLPPWAPGVQSDFTDFNKSESPADMGFPFQ